MNIGPYECVTPFETAGSGSARWCTAVLNGQPFFIKQFLSPVAPSPTAPAALRAGQQARCDAFEKRKKALYAALSLTLSDSVVPVIDFFSFEGRFYAVSVSVQPPYETFESLQAPPHARARQLLFDLARGLALLHAQGVVHADLKPEHVLVQKQDGRDHLRLIDFDSGFLTDSTEPADVSVEGDPVYLSPEAFLRLSGVENRLDGRMDTFAFGLIAHRMLTGRLPDPGEYGYVYDAVLSGGEVRLSERLPTAYRWVIRKALSLRPEDRPDDATLQRLFAPPPERTVHTGAPTGGLCRFLITQNKP